MKESNLKEIIYDQFTIFYKSKSKNFTIDPRMYNRKCYKMIGKFFVDMLKDLSENK